MVVFKVRICRCNELVNVCQVCQKYPFRIRLVCKRLVINVVVELVLFLVETLI